MKSNPLVRLALAVAAVAAPGWAQQAPTPAPSVSAPAEDKPAATNAPARQVGGLKFVDVAEVTIVNVNVAVTDKDRPVLTLKPSDFTVLQDGRNQPITNFALYAGAGQTTTPLAVATAGAAATPVATVAEPTSAPSPSRSPSAEALLAPKREPRFVIIYVDNANLLPFNRNRVINSAVDWVSNHLSPPDQMMVVSYQQSVKVLQPFTSDPDEVARALRATKQLTGARTDAINGRKQAEDNISQISRQGHSDPQAMNHALDQANAFAREQRNDLQFTIGALKELVMMMSGLPGKKAVIYVSDGLPMKPGLELYYGIQEMFMNASALSLARDSDSSDLLRGLVTTATAAGVTFYTIDARGLGSESGIEAENSVPRSAIVSSIALSNYQDSLIFMAEQTGGLAVLNSNDPSVGLNRIASDFETYYSLGYRLIPSGEDRRHRIEVKVNGHPEYRLNYRRSFIEKTLPSTIGDRVLSGLEFDLEDNPLGIELKTGEPSPAEAERWMLPVDVHVPLGKIALIPDGADLVGYVMVYYAARDNEGKQSELQRIEQAIRMPSKDYESARTQYYTVTASLLVEPGTYRISVGVRDELTNQAGYARVRRAVHPEKQ